MNLTARQIEIARAIARGWSDRSIAQYLALSRQTVKNHITAIQHKLGVKNRTSIAVYIITGWLPPYASERRKAIPSRALTAHDQQ